MSAQNGTEITVWDDSRIALTLDVANREIRRGDGLVIELTPEETAEAASAFLTIVAGDQIVAAVESSPPTQECPPDGPTCVEPTVGTFEDSGTSAIVTRLASSHPRDHRGGRFGSHIVRRGYTPGRPLKDRGNESGVATMAGDWPSSCLDIATAINDMMPEYNSSRGVYTNTLKVLLPIGWEDGSPRIKLRDYPDVLVALGMAFHRMQKAELQLNIMAGLYSASGCWNNTWRDFGGVGSSGGGGGGSLGGGYSLVCRTEVWEISYDGGVTWQFFAEVSVCEYKYTM